MTTAKLSVFLQKWFCGCGVPENACESLRKLLKWHEDWDHRDEMREYLGELKYLTLYTLDHFELIEHGGGVGSSWLTGLGENVLAGLEREKVADGYESLLETRCIHGNLCMDTQCPECA